MGVLSRKEKRDGAAPEQREETAAAGPFQLPRAVPLAAGRDSEIPFAGSRRSCLDPLPPSQVTGCRSGARTPAALRAPGVNGRSCPGAPRDLSRGGGCRLCFPHASRRLCPCPVRPGSRRGLGDDSGPARACAATANPVFRPSESKSAALSQGLRYPGPYSCDEPLGCQRVPAGHSVRLPPLFLLRGGCHGYGICNETGGLLPPWDHAWGSEASTRVRARRRGGRERDPTQISSRSIPAASVRFGDRALEAAPPHGHPRPGLPATSPALWPARFPGRQRMPVSVADTFTPGSRSPVSFSPGKPRVVPALRPRGKAGTKRVKLSPPPARSRTDPAGTRVPREAPCSPAGQRVPPDRAKQAPEPRFTIAPCVCGHPESGRSPVPYPLRRPVLLRASPGVVPSVIQLGKRFSPPVAERSRDEPRGKSTLSRAGAGLSRWGGRGLGDPAPRRPPASPGLGHPGRPPVAFSFPSRLGRSGEAATDPGLRHLRPTLEQERRRCCTRGCGHAWARCW